MLHIAIVEDDSSDSRLLEEYLHRYEAEKGEKFLISFFQDGLQFISDYTADYDIIYMDIEMPHLNGMEAARRLRQADETVCLIFVTNMAQYAIKGYEVNAMDFLLKPLRYFNFSLKLDKAVRSCVGRRETPFLIPSQSGHIRLYPSHILYVESDKHYLTFHTKDGCYRMRGSLKETERLLPDDYFVRCSNSHVVNLFYVTRLLSDTVCVEQENLPLSRSRKKEFADAFTRYLGGIH